MLRVLQRGTAMLTALMASLVFVTAALAQMPASPWKKGAPFPEPDEELYGVAANGKLYVIGGWKDGKAGGVTYEYDPATDKWTKKQSMPRPAHHAALAAANGKIYVMGGFVAPTDTLLPLGAAWQPIDDAWEENDWSALLSDSWRNLGSLPDGTYGLTYTYGNRSGIWYKTEHLENAGIEPPQTWDELIASFDGLGVGFDGPQGPSFVRNPSDNSLAVGPDHIIQTVNSRLAIFTNFSRRDSPLLTLNPPPDPDPDTLARHRAEIRAILVG